MISVSIKAITHQRLIGGLGIATVTTRRKTIEYTNMDFNYGPLKDIYRPIRGKLCSSCISCTNGKCFFAFPRYPQCHLPKTQ